LARREQIQQAIRFWDESQSPARHKKRGSGRFHELAEHKAWFAHWQIAIEIVLGGETLILCGIRGNGKTQMAVELLRSTCRDGRSCLYLLARQVGMRLREAYDGTIGEEAAIRKLVRPHLLVIDECQERPDKDFEQRSMTMLLDMRYMAKKPTVLIANWKLDKLSAILSDSILDRTHEGGGALVFDWPSFRGGKA